MTIYEELIQRVYDGEAFHIDFEKRTMKVGKNILIKDGKYDTARNLIGKPTMNTIDVIDELYNRYKYSLPSERHDGKKKHYFKTLTLDDMTDDRLFIAGRREVEQARLEGFILCSVLNGTLTWDEPTMGKWFYQSKNDPDLVILRKWIENK